MTHLHCTPGRIIGVASLVLGAVATASAQPAPVPYRGAVTVTAAVLGGEAALVAEWPGARLETRVSADGRGQVVAVAGDDRVEIALGPDLLRVSRGGVVRTLSARSLAPSDLRALGDLLRESAAIRAVVDVQDGVAADMPGPLASAAAFLRLLGGDSTAMRRVATPATARAVPGIRLARQDAVACWSSYQNSMWIFFQDLESCISSNHWNLPVQYACGFTYLVQSELAWFSLIACAGGLPTP
jgi:hypothetical protein